MVVNSKELVNIWINYLLVYFQTSLNEYFNIDNIKNTLLLNCCFTRRLLLLSSVISGSEPPQVTHDSSGQSTLFSIGLLHHLWLTRIQYSFKINQLSAALYLPAFVPVNNTSAIRVRLLRG